MKTDKIDCDVPQLPPSTIDGPTLSIVMPTFRRPDYIEKTLQSLLSQSFRDFELLVRDDGDGMDGTETAVLTASRGDMRVKYRRNPKRLGMPGNLNEGIKASQGKLILVSHDHDTYDPEFLKQMIETLERNPTALYIHCASRLQNPRSNDYFFNVGKWPELSKGADWLKFMLSQIACPVAALTLVRRSTYEKYGLYNPSFGFISDVEMWMRLALYGDVGYVPLPLITLGDRENDHIMVTESKKWLGTTIKIHRLYIPLVYKAGTQFFKLFSLEKRHLYLLLRIQVHQIYLQLKRIFNLVSKKESAEHGK